MSEVMGFQGKAGILTRPTDSRILISASYVSNLWERADRRLEGKRRFCDDSCLPSLGDGDTGSSSGVTVLGFSILTVTRELGVPGTHDGASAWQPHYRCSLGVPSAVTNVGWLFAVAFLTHRLGAQHGLPLATSSI